VTGFLGDGVALLYVTVARANFLICNQAFLFVSSGALFFVRRDTILLVNCRTFSVMDSGTILFIRGGASFLVGGRALLFIRDRAFILVDCGALLFVHS